MPSEVTLTIIKARDLPVMDRAQSNESGSQAPADRLRGTTNAYCVVSYGKTQEGQALNRSAFSRQRRREISAEVKSEARSKRNRDYASESQGKEPQVVQEAGRSTTGEHFTSVCEDALNPEWNEQMVFSNCDDEDLQERYFDISVRSGDKLIGSVIIDLSYLLQTRDEFDDDQNRLQPQILKAWFPIFNYEQGLRGDLKVQVKMSFLKDENIEKVIQSTDVEFFCQVLPPPHQVKQVLKFVEEQLEFKRRPDDKILETMNVIESRSLRLRRKLARKVSLMGGNAVIGYMQTIDDEGLKSQRVVIRGYGTAIVLVSDSGELNQKDDAQAHEEKRGNDDDKAGA